MSKTQTPQVAGHNKYLPLSSLLSPFSIPAWSAGLQAINQSPSLLVEASKSFNHFGHYAFPDPRIFISPASKEKKAKFIESWLQIHVGWLMRVVNETLLAMSGQNWHNLLSNDLSAIQEKNDTKAAKHHQQALAMLVPKYEHFPDVKTWSTAGEPVTWHILLVCYLLNMLFKGSSGSYFSSILHMNSCHWTVMLAQLWTLHQTIHNWYRDRPWFQNVFLSILSNLDHFQIVIVDWP